MEARDNHPNAVQLEEEIARLEKAAGALVCTNGMAAVGVVAVATLGQGGRVLASDRLYGRTTQLLFQELSHFGVHAEAVDTTNPDAVATALQRPDAPPPRLLVVETLSNPLLSAADLPRLIDLCRQHQTQLLVDNTFATPVLCRPVELGAAFVVESLTKMMGGHSDITLGAVVVQDAELLPRLRQIRSIWGWIGDPFPCWLALRGLPTLELRMTAACANADRLACFLAEHPAVARVVHPSRPEHPDHKLVGTLCGGRYGNMLCFELAAGRDAVNRFLHRAPGLKFCPSLGDYATTCSHPASTSHQYLEPEERARQGITEGLVRLSVGIEPWEGLEREFRRGLGEGDVHH